MLAGGQRNFEIRERDVAIRGRNEIFTLDDRQQFQDVLVQHIPGTDLLFDHVETRLLDVHVQSAGRSTVGVELT